MLSSFNFIEFSVFVLSIFKGSIFLDDDDFFEYFDKNDFSKA
jgi:hypothetical protein